MAEGNIRTISWEALEHHHGGRSGDWYWALGVITIAAVGTTIVLGNFLFAIVLLLATTTMAILAARGPMMIAYTIGPRGIRIGEELFPYTTIESFYLDEDHPKGPQLLLKSERFFMPLMIVPLPEEHVDTIDDMLGQRLPEEHMEEGVFHIILEFFGF